MSTETVPRRRTNPAWFALTAIIALVIGAGAGALLSPPQQGNTATSPTKALLGMSAPNNLWKQRLSEVGPGLEARRIFFVGFTANLALATTACNDGMVPILSFKESPYTPAQVAAGAADSQLISLHARLVALPCAVYVTIHHEPNGDMTAAQYSAMLIHALPILGGSMTDPEVQVGAIGNGFWFNSDKQGLSDSALDTWLGPGVRAVSNFIAADTYQLKAGAEEPGSKMRRMVAWAKRVNVATPKAPVRGLGIGEFNSETANGTGIADALVALAADPLWRFGCLWNVNLSTVTVLVGARLTAFQHGLAGW